MQSEELGKRTMEFLLSVLRPSSAEAKQDARR
jgi:hypothetical protein